MVVEATGRAVRITEDTQTEIRGGDPLAILREVLARHEQARSPREALAALGGFEIATMAGAVLEAVA